MRRAALLALALALSACGEGEIVTVGAPQYAAVAKPPPVEAARTERALDGYAPRPGYTYATAQQAHGIQIEYFSPEGRSFLWYPGNSAVVPGEYRYKLFVGPETTSIYDIEFRYPATSRNPVSGQYGGDWNWTPGGAYQRQVIAYAKGDPFGLATGRVPFVRRDCQLPAPMRQMAASPVAPC